MLWVLKRNVSLSFEQPKHTLKLMGKKTLIILCPNIINLFKPMVFFMLCSCFKNSSVSLSHGTVDWAAVCDCGNSWPYSLFDSDPMVVGHDLGKTFCKVK